MLAGKNCPRKIAENALSVPADIDAAHLHERGAPVDDRITGALVLEAFSIGGNRMQLVEEFLLLLLALRRLARLTRAQKLLVVRFRSAETHLAAGKFDYVRYRLGNFGIALHGKDNSCLPASFSGDALEEPEQNRAALHVETRKRVAQDKKLFFRKKRAAQKRPPDFPCGHEAEPPVEDFLDSAKPDFGKRLEFFGNRRKRQVAVLRVRAAHHLRDEPPSRPSLVDFVHVFSLVELALLLDKAGGNLKRDRLDGMLEFVLEDGIGPVRNNSPQAGKRLDKSRLSAAVRPDDEPRLAFLHFPRKILYKHAPRILDAAILYFYVLLKHGHNYIE